MLTATQLVIGMPVTWIDAKNRPPDAFYITEHLIPRYGTRDLTVGEIDGNIISIHKNGKPFMLDGPRRVLKVDRSWLRPL